MATRAMIGVLLLCTVLVCEMGLSTSKPLELEVTINGHNQVENGTERILYGELAENHAYPWQVQILGVHPTKKVDYCGGAIICPDYVLTAAHCVEREEWKKEIVVGVNIVGDPEEQRKQVEKTIIHPKYLKDPNNKWDYALLKLLNSIIIRPEATPLYLPRPGGERFRDGTKFAVTGWGETEKSEYPLSLQVVSMYHLNSPQCPFRPNEIKPNQLCMAPGGICAGDSGGPAAWIDPETSEGENKVKLIGLLSHPPVQCSTKPSPIKSTLISRVSTVVNWINENTKGCNQKVCSKGQCMTKNKLKPQARQMMKPDKNNG